MKLDRKILRTIAIGLLLLAVLEMVQKQLGIIVDNTTVLIIGLAILIYLLPDLSNISKFKYGDLELEFEKNLDKIEKLVIAEENVGSSTSINKKSTIKWQHYYAEYNTILNSKSANLEKILRASQLVELMIAEAGNDFDLKSKSPTNTMRELFKHGLISNDELLLFEEFYSFRNRIIHGDIRDISDSLTTRILDILWRMVKIFA